MRILSKRSGMLAALGIGLGVALTAVAYAVPTFGPSRPTFTWAHPAHYNTFNSITDNPFWGDERYIVKARDAGSSDSSQNKTSMTVTDGEELLVTTYFHNNAASDLNLTATNTKVKDVLPTGNNTTQTITSYISADNANPTEVWSTMELTMGGSQFTVEYVPGSAVMKSNYVNTAVSDNVVNGGVLVGTNAADGKVKGCSENAGAVYIHVRVHKVTPPSPKYSCDLLTVTVGDNRKVTGSVAYTAQNGATLKNVHWTWGDNATDDTGTVTTKDHTYASDGNKTINVSLDFDVNGSAVSGVTSQACSKTVNVNTPTPPSTPPTQLPNTGAGSVVGIFAGVSALAGAAHYVLSGRKVRG